MQLLIKKLRTTWSLGLLVTILANQAVSIPVFGSAKQQANQHILFPQDAAPSKIVFRDLNFLQLTDVHSWLSGHAHQSYEEAGYSDVLAFFQHLKQLAAAEGKDIFLFNSGDIVDGTGLSDATEVRGVRILPIIEQMPFSALTSGNHELYHSASITNIAQQGFVEHWQGRYLTANIHNATTGELIGNPYTVITGDQAGTKILVMGFLYNMENHCDAVTVTHVEDALQEAWFGEAMKQAADVEAIVLLVHMGASDPLTQAILTAIRASLPTANVVFLAGHTHVRDFHQFDSGSVAMESGKYLDTVGFLSCDLTASKGMACEHAFVTPHVPTFREYTKTSKATFETPEAKKMRRDIDVIRASLGLDEVIGCSPKKYDLYVPLDDPKSMWGLYIDTVLPTVLYPDVKHAVFVASTGALRYNFFKGKVHLDDTYIVGPFKDLYYMSQIPGSVLAPMIKIILDIKQDMLTARTSAREWVEWEMPWVSTMAVTEVKSDVTYNVLFVEFDAARVAQVFMTVTGGELAMKPYRSADVDSRSVWELFVRKEWPCKKQ